MTSRALPAERFSDPPTDFAAFVARERGLGLEQATELIIDWLASYESPAPRSSQNLPQSYLP